MPSTLIIVESPTKVKTLKQYLGSGYTIKASVGHIKDLPKSKLGIDIEHDFTPTYTVKAERKKTMAELKQAARSADRVLLAPDPDREGEAIAWHIAEEIKRKDKKIFRVLFGDLTKKTIQAALDNPLPLDENKYEAQQTRRILDRLVGYQISPILWEKVQRGLSAGRVQSVAVRIICEREREILGFTAEEFWTLSAHLEGRFPPAFEAKLLRIDGKKKTVGSEAEAAAIVAELENESFRVESVEKKAIKRQPAPPFTTSKLQQEAAQRFRYSAKRTMALAQKLYEGIELGSQGPVGLITYMRTDSVRVAGEALEEARAHIAGRYGRDYLPARPRVFKTSKTAQDAHEAIRPSSLAYHPEDIKEFLGRDEFRLYQLIWNRFIASQMSPAIYDRTTIDITAGRFLFRAQGAVMTFPGYTTVWSEATPDKDPAEDGDDPDHALPLLTGGDVLKLLKLDPRQNFTQPPPRFTEASLVRELEERGIGRPSTYAAIIGTIQDRNYVTLEKRRFRPTELGMVVTDLLVDNFPGILDISFTASMEDKLDRIEEGSLKRVDTLKEFYDSFKPELEKAKSLMRNLKKEEEPTDIICDKCGSQMVIKWGRNGKFIACSNYPACKNTANIRTDDAGRVERKEPEVTDIICGSCGKNMVVKEGRFGTFLGCSGYPECSTTRPIDTGVACPQGGCSGMLCERRSKRGRVFYGCSAYPACTFAIWNRPVPEACPRCGSPYLVEKYTKASGAFKACPVKECGYKKPAGGSA
ncbi:MAG: type I DNA topoisomerase [Syntrophales bacterium]|jgi:DNA topoisomerase-1|nr:type I DNA topoisomerase [Syntrophales bacterium]MCK9527600.1 type I DNA topoisomerase [Syntrophales bacterium]MDX9922217.1 type I DNA topoisomerase [Syntrophales bacterium]